MVHEVQGAADSSLPAQVPAEAVAAAGFSEGGVWIRVKVARDAKCVRCWHHRADVGASSEHPQLCSRCIGNLSMPGEQRVYS
jgi:isoleucyl-tRNA synthetase